MMQTAAILWHVSLLVSPDRRALALGMVGLVRLVPIIVFSVTAGAIADALDRRRVMLLTQCAMGATAIVLAVLSFPGRGRRLAYLRSRDRVLGGIVRRSGARRDSVARATQHLSNAIT